MEYSYSLVICCYNSSQVIRPTILSLGALEYNSSDRIEIIVVDNNCSDDTIKIITSEWNNPDINLSIVKEKEPGLMNARKKGVDNIKNDIVVFIDDDNILDKNWLINLDKVYSSNANVGCVGGRVVPLDSNEYPWWFGKFQSVYACGDQAEDSMIVSKTRMTLFGAGLSFRSNIIKNIFNEGNRLLLTGRTNNCLLRGDDSELCMRCLMSGFDVYYSKKLLIHHNILPGRVNWDYVSRARFGGGVAEIILSIYRAINSGKSPNTYTGELFFVVRRWLRFISKPSSFFKVRHEGSIESFEYQFLKGLVYGLIIFYPLKYRRIRGELLDAVSNIK